MITHIQKRNGSIEPFSPTKLNGWGEWASKTLGPSVDWASVVLDTVVQCPATCTSLMLQKKLIETCLSRKTWEYNRMAGRLYAALTTRDLYPDGRPTIAHLHQRLFEHGIMVGLDYSADEYEQVEKIIDHKLDLKYPHYQLHQIRYKYALRNRVTGQEYESPQFVFMRMAMALAEKEPKAKRMEHVKNWYEHFSHGRINAPTPNFVNLGTKLNGYASCSVYTTDDTAPSLAAGDHIAYMMTCMSAGIGSHIKTRSMKDPVRGGVIEHQGKLPYYRAMVGAIGANLQNGRGGAATVHYSAFDPEVEVIQKLRHPMTPQAKRIAGCHYSFGSNRVFARKVAMNQDYAPFSYYGNEEMFEAQYDKDQTKFERLYADYEKEANVKLNAREIVVGALSQSYDTGVQYLHFMDALNKHTPFKEKIYSSNLCLPGDTVVELLIDGREEHRTFAHYIEEYNRGGVLAGAKIRSYNVGVRQCVWSEVTAAAQTAVVTELYRIETASGHSVRCTDNHQIYTTNRGFVEARYLMMTDNVLVGTETEAITCISVNQVDPTPVYDITVKDTECFYADGVLVHNCQEIALPTSPYKSVVDLYADKLDYEPEIALCSLAALVPANIESDEQYADAAYYALKMIDACIHKSDYVFPSLERTAKARLSAGVGIVGLAHYMAKNHKKYDTEDGRNFVHELMETQSWHLINASLRLGKELGNAPWMHKTLWPQGWLPIDTYEKRVDELVSVETKRDWEGLRQKIVENGGIRNSVVSCFMPSESSSIASGTTNGIYPIRELSIMKTNDTMVNYWVAPDATKLKNRYQSAWDISTTDMIKFYAVVQKWTDQGISADLYARLDGVEKVSSTQVIQDYLDLVKYGLKTRYYVNSLTSKGVDLNSEPEDNPVVVDEEPGVCESCTL